jgi:hypothetical protein
MFCGPVAAGVCVVCAWCVRGVSPLRADLNPARPLPHRHSPEARQALIAIYLAVELHDVQTQCLQQHIEFDDERNDWYTCPCGYAFMQYVSTLPQPARRWSHRQSV